MDNNSKKIEDYLITSEPYYEPVGTTSIFESALSKSTSRVTQRSNCTVKPDSWNT